MGLHQARLVRRRRRARNGHPGCIRLSRFLPGWMFNVATIFCAFAVVPVMPLVGLPPIAAGAARLWYLARRRTLVPMRVSACAPTIKKDTPCRSA